MVSLSVILQSVAIFVMHHVDIDAVHGNVSCISSVTLETSIQLCLTDSISLDEQCTH